MSEKIAVVTGSNKSIGFTIVKGLCQNFNGIVYLTARDENRGKNAVKKLNAIGLKPEFHVLDITKEESLKKFGDFLKKKHGGFDVLVNNAAILGWDEIYPTYEAAKRNIDVNYRGLLKVEEYLYPLLRNGAKVININSINLSNLRNEKCIEFLENPDLTEEQLNGFVEEYLESVKNGTFDKNYFADEGRVSRIAVAALTVIQQRKYAARNIAVNTVYPERGTSPAVWVHNFFSHKIVWHNFLRIIFLA